MRVRQIFIVTLVAGVGLLPAASAAAATAPAPIEGSGSSWAAPGVDSWAQDTAADGLQVSYDGDGSAAGRERFADSQTDFAVTDLPYLNQPVARAYALLPTVGGAVSFPYNITVGGRTVRDLRLSGSTLAGIFSGRIVNWNDPAITADNNGRQVAADLAITPVVRSDGAATSYQLTGWFSGEFGKDWHPFSHAGATEFFPVADGTVSRNGGEQTASYIAAPSSDGAIGYVENSYAQAAGLPTAAVLNRGGYFIPPTAGNTALALLKALPNPAGPADLRPVWHDADPRAVPAVVLLLRRCPDRSQRPTDDDRQAAGGGRLLRLRRL